MGIINQDRLRKAILAAGSIALHGGLITLALTPPAARIHADPRPAVIAVRLIAPVVPIAPVVSEAPVTPVGPVTPVVAVSGIPPEPVPIVPSKAEAAPETEAGETYLPSVLMDRRPTPVSEPDLTIVEGVPSSGLPVRLRIYIDRFGTVVNVVTLEAGILDDEFVIALQKMFRATAFLPGGKDGIDVPSYMDIELLNR